MTKTDRPISDTLQVRADPAPLRQGHGPSSAMAERLARPHSREEAEQRYVAAREAWTAAMRTANSGRSSDLAALALRFEELRIMHEPELEVIKRAREGNPDKL